MLQVRNRLYELLVNAISPELIIKKLTYELMQKLDSELKHEVCAYAAYFEHRIQLGQKAIIHLEAFVARFMAVYKRYAAARALFCVTCAERTRHAHPFSDTCLTCLVDKLHARKACGVIHTRHRNHAAKLCTSFGCWTPRARKPI